MVPQLLWIKKIRMQAGILFVISIIVNIGMWLERYVIIVTSLHRDFLPSSWGMYQGSRWDWSFYLGTMGLFLTLFYLFIRVLPMIAIFEMRMLLPGGSQAQKDAAH
jgi:molybdopterin-containing oxidoreductase family membrane subunit